MLEPTVAHLRANAIAYLALFVALGGTSAYAADSVFSADIVDGEVKTADLATDAVTRANLADLAVGTRELAPNAVTAKRIAPDAVGSSEIEESDLDVVKGPATSRMRFAREQLSGTEVGPSPVISEPGVFELNAGRNRFGGCSLTLVNPAESGVTLAFVRESLGEGDDFSSGDLAPGSSNGIDLTTLTRWVRWQLWVPGDATSEPRVFTIESAMRTADGRSFTCDFSAVLALGA